MIKIKGSGLETGSEIGFWHESKTQFRQAHILPKLHHVEIRVSNTRLDQTHSQIADERVVIADGGDLNQLLIG